MRPTKFSSPSQGACHRQVDTRPYAAQGGSEVEFDFSDEDIRRLGEEAARQRALQDVYDRMLSMGQGKPVEGVKAVLAHEWRLALGDDITDPVPANSRKRVVGLRRIPRSTNTTIA